MDAHRDFCSSKHQTTVFWEYKSCPIFACKRSNAQWFVCICNPSASPRAKASLSGRNADLACTQIVSNGSATSDGLPGASTHSQPGLSGGLLTPAPTGQGTSTSLNGKRHCIFIRKQRKTHASRVADCLVVLFMTIQTHFRQALSVFLKKTLFVGHRKYGHPVSLQAPSA